MHIVLTSEILLAAYAQGLFPMAESAHSPYVHWYCPQERGQLSICGLHIPKKLKKEVRQMCIGGKPYEIRINTSFKAVIDACAEHSATRPETWINEEIKNAYIKLHEEGYAHSVECWQEEKLVGGLYGVALGAAFFGESMFSCVSEASKVSLVHLAARLWKAEFKMLDTQFVNTHLEQFGVYEVYHDEYMRELRPLLLQDCDFTLNIDESELIAAYFMKCQ